MSAINYHNATVTFIAGQTVTHVNDAGEMLKATVKSLVLPDALELVFADGNEGTELTTTCF
jgi:hypothetical protein